MLCFNMLGYDLENDACKEMVQIDGCMHALWATYAWAGYCLPIEFEQAVGLCAEYTGAPNVCSASIGGENIKSGQYWHDNEVFNIRAPHTDKTLLKGTQSFETLQLYIVNWACKQMGENVRQRNDLSDDQKQTAACNFVWRRDQEIQNDANFSVPATGFPWGTFMYKPPGKNLTTFVFKGAPKQQCANDYECREVNTPGDVYTSCDFCEEYFNSYCDITASEVFKFCMEKVHCVCNSVTKPCAIPNKKRCPMEGGACRERGREGKKERKREGRRVRESGQRKECHALPSESRSEIHGPARGTDGSCRGAPAVAASPSSSSSSPLQRSPSATQRFPTAVTFRCMAHPPRAAPA